MNRVLMILCLCGLGISCSNAEKSDKPQQTSKIVRSFNITPGYLERTFNSNESMKVLPLSLMQLSTKGFDASVGAVDNSIAKLGVGFAYNLWTAWLALANNVVYHEFGHARSYAALGLSYTYYADERSSTPSLNSDYAHGLYICKVLNPRYFFHGARTDLDESEPNPIYPWHYVAQRDLIMSAGGLNNNANYSQSICNLIYKDHGHLMYWQDYFVGKMTPFFYYVLMGESSDIRGILDGYGEKDIHCRGKDIAKASLMSLLLSSTTWSFVYSGVTELPKGSFAVHAPVWKRWRLPDLNFFLTTQGLSYQVVTGYQWNPNWYTGLTTEFVYKGNTAWEVGPSIGYTFTSQGMGQIDLSAQLIVSNEGEFGGNARAEWTAPAKNWRVGLHYIYHNAMTLVGERNIPFLSSGLMFGGEPSATNHEINLTVSYLY